MCGYVLKLADALDAFLLNGYKCNAFEGIDIKMIS